MEEVGEGAGVEGMVVAVGVTQGAAGVDVEGMEGEVAVAGMEGGVVAEEEVVVEAAAGEVVEEGEGTNCGGKEARGTTEGSKQWK